jgi:hypothetical protein
VSTAHAPWQREPGWRVGRNEMFVDAAAAILSAPIDVHAKAATGLPRLVGDRAIIIAVAAVGEAAIVVGGDQLLTGLRGGLDHRGTAFAPSIGRHLPVEQQPSGW